MNPLTFDEFQQRAEWTAIYPNRGENVVYPALGLAGESGEVAEKVKKLIRDKGGKIDDEFCQAIAKELGDVLWYVSQLCRECGLSLGAVAGGNLMKLAARQQKGTLRGSGDDR